MRPRPGTTVVMMRLQLEGTKRKVEGVSNEQEVMMRLQLEGTKRKVEGVINEQI